MESIKKNPRVIVRYSQNHDLIYSYDWSLGKLVGIRKYVDGVQVSPKPAEVEVLDVE